MARTVLLIWEGEGVGALWREVTWRRRGEWGVRGKGGKGYGVRGKGEGGC